MKKTSALFIVLIGLSLLARAQATTYKTMGVGVYLGVGGFPYGGENSGNLTLEFLGRPTTSDNFALGFRGQFAFAYDNNVYTSVCITSDYYLSRPENGVRVFAGGGLGIFNELSTTGNGDYFFKNFFNLNSGNFGFFPRIGIQAGRFRLSGEYDFTGGVNNYTAINLGFFFGDGSKK